MSDQPEHRESVTPEDYAWIEELARRCDAGEDHGDIGYRVVWSARYRRILSALRQNAAPRDEPETVWHAFHRAWTACVGTSQYDKAPWRECSKQVGDVVGPMGHVSSPPLPAVQQEPSAWLLQSIDAAKCLLTEPDLKAWGPGWTVTPLYALSESIPA